MSRIALLESDRHLNGARSPAGTSASLSLHLAILALAIVATTRSRGAVNLNEPVIMPVVRWPAAQSPKPPSTPKLAAPVPAIAQQRPLLPPLAVPSVIPPVATATPPVGAVSLPTAPAMPGSSALPGADTGAEGGNGSLFTTDDVDVPAAPLGGQRGPVYPEGLQRMGIAGRVLVRFTVGTNGRMESEPTILSATNSEFAASVRRYLASTRYMPATRNGHAVRQLAEQEFLFQVRQ